MLSILIAVLVIAIVVFVAFWIIDSIGIPQPINMITKAIVGIIALVAILIKSGLTSVL
jgi:hypothetical protein